MLPMGLVVRVSALELELELQLAQVLVLVLVLELELELVPLLALERVLAAVVGHVTLA